MLNPKILLVSNLQTTLPLWVFHSLEQRLHVVLESQPVNIIQCWQEENPNLVIFDLEPEELALAPIKDLRAKTSVPILLLTSNHTEEALLEAYQAGADECILKPIHPSLFHAKLVAWLRRLEGISGELLDALKVGSIQFIRSNRSIILGDQNPIRLTNLELRLISYLIERPGRPVATKELCQSVWGGYRAEDKATLKNVVYRLRRKIEANPAKPHYIRTVGRAGYQFVIE